MQQHWNSDTMLCALLGDWWCVDMELREGSTMEQCVATANEWLLSMGHEDKKVFMCKDTDDSSEMLWLCNFLVKVG